MTWNKGSNLEKKIEEKTATIGIVGLGYVGLPLAMTTTKKGFTVNGYDIDSSKIELLNKKTHYLKGEEWLDTILENSDNFKASDKAEESGKNDIIIVAVPTPADPKTRMPKYDYIISSAEKVGNNLKKGALVILESTVGPGTTEGIFRETIEKVSGLKAGKDFGLGYSPERINPGDHEHRIESVTKVVSGMDPASKRTAALFYSNIAPKVFCTEKIMEAELTKLMENIQRDTNIALANEFAKICDAYKLDVKNVIDAASTKWNFYRVMPSCGVGGHCLPDDPWFLIHEVEKKDIKSDLIRQARKVNEEMPAYTARKMQMVLGKKPNGSKIAIIGLTYKSDINDTRNSPSKTLIEEIRNMGYTNLIAHDPYIPISEWVKTDTFEEAIKDAEIVIITAAHKSLKDLTPETIKRLAPNATIIDGTNLLDRDGYLSRKINFEGIGR